MNRGTGVKGLSRACIFLFFLILRALKRRIEGQDAFIGR